VRRFGGVGVEPGRIGGAAVVVSLDVNGVLGSYGESAEGAVQVRDQVDGDIAERPVYQLQHMARAGHTVLASGRVTVRDAGAERIGRIGVGVNTESFPYVGCAVLVEPTVAIGVFRRLVLALDANRSLERTVRRARVSPASIDNVFETVVAF